MEPSQARDLLEILKKIETSLKQLASSTETIARVLHTISAKIK